MEGRLFKMFVDGSFFPANSSECPRERTPQFPDSTTVESHFLISNPLLLIPIPLHGQLNEPSKSAIPPKEQPELSLQLIDLRPHSLSDGVACFKNFLRRMWSAIAWVMHGYWIEIVTYRC